MDEFAEDNVWLSVDPDDIWVMDKLILSRKMGYVCGPVGLDVKKRGYYIVRPCVNMLGLGLGATKMFLDGDTCDLPYGYFWCEWFEGRHLSVDYQWGVQSLCVEGIKPADTFTKWDEWVKVEDKIPFPSILKPLAKKYKWINCEFIGGKLIEVHLRHNMDFADGITHFIPVWYNESTIPPSGYSYVKYPDMHGRIGAFIK